MSNSVKGILVVGMRSASYPTLEKYVCSSTVQYKARPKISDKRRLQHSISAIVFFKTPIVCWSYAPGRFWMSPPFFIKAMQTSLERERFAQNYYDFCFDFHVAASCCLGIFPLIFVGTEPGTELGRISLQTQRIRSNILSDVVNILAILQQGFHKVSCFSRGHLFPKYQR